MAVKLRLLAFASCFAIACTQAAFAQQTGEVIYTYDELGRVIYVTDPENGDREYNYDPAGNRTTVATGTDTSGPPDSGGDGSGYNHDPVAVNDIVGVGSTETVLIDLGVNDSDEDGDTLTITAVTQPSNATVQLSVGTIVRITGNFVFSGSQFSNFTYTLSDGQGGTDSATVALTVSSSGGGPGGGGQLQ